MLSSTWPNRKYLHSGRRGADDDTQIIPGDHRLRHDADLRVPRKAGRSRRQTADLEIVLQRSSVPRVLVRVRRRHALHNFGTIERFVDDCRDDTLPSVSIVDPPFTLADDHPPHDPALGQKFIGLVVDALTHSPAWDKSVLLIVYDEAGGFYDHVPPPKSVIDDDQDANLGFRVPAIIVSPYSKPGTSHTLYDHTSFVATLKELWNLDEQLKEQGNEYGVRWPRANSFLDALDFGTKNPIPRGVYTGDPRRWRSELGQRHPRPLGLAARKVRRLARTHLRVAGAQGARPPPGRLRHARQDGRQGRHAEAHATTTIRRRSRRPRRYGLRQILRVKRSTT